jgi:translation initiation factor 5A
MDVQEDGFLVLLNEDGTTKEDLKLPETEDDLELSIQIKTMFGQGTDILVSVMSAMGQEKVVGCRQAQD